jgi:hypothetical protein
MVRKLNNRKHQQTSLVSAFANVPSNSALSLADQISLDKVPLYNDHQGRPDTCYIYKTKVHTDKVIVYKQYLEPRSRSQSQIDNNSNLSRGQYNGYVGRSGARKIRCSLEAWIKSIEINRKLCSKRSKPRHSFLTFVTLTLPSEQDHSDNEIKREVLMPFIQRMQREIGVKEYFWKAEPQQNGNIHFHLLVDRFIRKELLQQYWNMSTEKLGYLSRYFEKSGSLFPPSTDIRICPDGMGLVSYVMKYVSKSPLRIPSFGFEGGKRIKRDRFVYRKRLRDGSVVNQDWRAVGGRVWGMSDGIRSAKVFSSEGSCRWANFVKVLAWDSEVGLKSEENFAVFYCNTQAKMFEYDKVLLADYRRYYAKLYKELYFPKKEPDVILLPDIVLRVDPPIFVPIYSQSRLQVG